ncbi:hypothetical protein GGQ67_003483 [Rhizobium metallidurans]|uniref:Uncharacterized protein n=1 Tax=Rhizobium metallidurans TaxID=1265931 RepID=A0A7W6CTA2_9HYPH|nr:hypothetical protein [Rhizobium metallidurans]
MTMPTPLISRSRVDAQANIAAFITHSRDEVAAFDPHLDFDSDCWDIGSVRARGVISEAR